MAKMAAVGVSLLLSLLLMTGVVSSGCMTAYKNSVGANVEQLFTKIYLTEFNMAWQAALEALKSYRLDVSNREAGFIQTKWIENTAGKNFVDSFGPAGAYLKAQFRLKVHVAKGVHKGRSSVKLTIQKEQLVQRDVLEGWRPVETDAIEENTLLYRIGRIIMIRSKLNRLEEERIEQEMEEAQEDFSQEEI